MATVTKRKWTYKGQAKEAWEVRYHDASGKRRGKTFGRKKDAEGYRVKVEGELASGLHVAANSRTVGSVLDEFLEREERRFERGKITRSTMKNKRMYAAKVREYMGGRIAQSIDWQEAERFIDWLRDRPATNRPGKTICGAYAKDATVFADMLFTYAEKRSYIARNPFPNARKEAGRDTSETITPFTKEEIARLLVAIERRSHKCRRRVTALLRAMAYLGMFCGLRKGEILGLTVDAIDYDAGLIRVRQGWTAPDNIGKPKTPNAIRDVPLPPVVAKALEAWRPFIVANPRNLLFRTATGRQPFNGDFYSGAWWRALNEAGIEPDEKGQRHFHALRHFAGSAWLDMGIPLPTVSRLLGHANPGITARIYAHVIENTATRAAQVLACAAEIAALPAPANDARVTQQLLSA